jgi:hypothetical protein
MDSRFPASLVGKERERPLLPPCGRSRFRTAPLIPPGERREVLYIPCLAEARAAQIPVWANFAGHGAQVVAKIDDRRRAPEPVAVT